MLADTALDAVQLSTPASPAAGRNKIYPKSDGKWYTLNSAGVETLVGEPPIAAGTTAQYWRGDKIWQTLDKVAVGLSNVANVLQFSLSNLPAFSNITGTIDDSQLPSRLVNSYYTTDCNSATAAGFWYTGVGIANAPSGASQYMLGLTLVRGSVGSGVYQQIYDMVSARVWSRVYNGAAWSSWSEFVKPDTNGDSMSVLRDLYVTRNLAAASGVYESSGAVRVYSGNNPPAFYGITGTIADSQLMTRIGPNGKGSVTDWNACTTPGWYNGNSAANAPMAGWFLGIVSTHDSNPANLYVTQTVWCFTDTTATDSYCYERRCLAGTWTAWRKVRYLESELDARYAQRNSNNYWVGFNSFGLNAAPSDTVVVELTNDSGPVNLRLHNPGEYWGNLRLDVNGFSVRNGSGDGLQNFLAYELTAQTGVYESSGGVRVWSPNNLVPAATGLSGQLPDSNLQNRLHAASSESAVADANDARGSGHYYFNGSYNGPAEGVGDCHLYVTGYNDNYVSQILIPIHSDRVFVRRRDNGVWYSWVEISPTTAVSRVADSLRAGYNVSGGGQLYWGGGNFLWNARFIIIGNGRGSHFSTTGYFDLDPPPVGTVITGVGGAGNATVTASGVPMLAWQALYYIMPIGSNNATVHSNWRMANYSADLTVPDNWLLVAVVNSDDGSLKVCNGVHIATGGYYSTPGNPYQMYSLTTHNHSGVYEPVIAAGTTAQYYRGDKTWQTLNATAVGLGNVANTLQYSASNPPSFSNINGYLNITQMPTSGLISEALLGTGTGTVGKYLRGDSSWQPLTPGAVNAEPTISGGTTAQYWRGDKTWQTLDKTAVGLSNVSNLAQVATTTDQTVAGVKTFSSSPIVPTPTTASQAATKAYVDGLASSITVVTSSTRPASPTNGLVIYESDTKNTLIYDSGAASWKYVGEYCICTSSTRPTGSMLQVGLCIFETDTGKMYNWYGGSWVQVTATGPQELGYAQITANSAVNSSGALQDVTGLSTTVTVGSRPINIYVNVDAQHSVATAGFLIVYIREGTTIIKQGAIFEYGQAGAHTIAFHARIAPSAGSHTYKVSTLYTGGNIQIMASATDPAFIQVMEC